MYQRERTWELYSEWIKSLELQLVAMHIAGNRSAFRCRSTCSLPWYTKGEYEPQDSPWPAQVHDDGSTKVLEVKRR
jgi:hypothetical protein